MTPPSIFLTGATGHLGVAIAHALLSKPDPPSVRLLVRSADKLRTLIAAEPALAPLERAELVVGDFRDRATLEKGTRDTDVVIHNLHSHEYWKGTQHIVDVNVGGARTLAEVAVEAGVGHFIYIGSYSIHDKTDGPSEADLAPMAARGASSQAKYVVQKALEAASDEGNRFRLDVVSPSYMMGPWQLDPTYFGVLFHVPRFCRLKWTLPGGVNLVDVRDVAQAVVDCIEKESPQKILASGDDMTFQDMFRIMNRVGGRPYDPKIIPPGLLRAVPRLRFFGDFGKYYFDRPHFVDRPTELTRRFSVEQTIADTVEFAGKNRMFKSRWHLLRWVAKRYL